MVKKSVNIKEFVNITNGIFERYNKLQSSLDETIAKRDIAQEISFQIDDAISNADIKKIQDSIDLSAFPSFGFTKEQTQEMINDVLNDIASDQISLNDYINSQDESIYIMQDTVLGGIEEEFDPEKPESLVYHYKKDLEISRIIALDTLIQCQKISLETVPENLTPLINQKDIMMKNFGIEYEIDSVDEHINHISSTLLAYSVLKSMGGEINEQKFSEELSKSRVYVETMGTENDLAKMSENVSSTIDSLIKECPDFSDDLNNIKEAYFSSNSLDIERE